MNLKSLKIAQKKGKLNHVYKDIILIFGEYVMYLRQFLTKLHFKNKN